MEVCIIKSPIYFKIQFILIKLLKFLRIYEEFFKYSHRSRFRQPHERFETLTKRGVKIFLDRITLSFEDRVNILEVRSNICSPYKSLVLKI